MHRQGLAIFGLGLLLRLAFVLSVPNIPYSDGVWYDAAAWRLASLGEYGIHGPSAWLPPGYPLFLAALYSIAGHAPLIGKVVNGLLGAGTCLLAYLLGSHLFGRKVGLGAGLIIASWPNLIFHAAILSSDLLAAFGFVAFLWLARNLGRGPRDPWPRQLALGLLFGGLVLTRPVALILIPAVALDCWLASRSWARVARGLAPLMLIGGLMCGAWTLRNYARLGMAVPIATSGGYDFWIGNNDYTDGSDRVWAQAPVDDPQIRTMREGGELIRHREGWRLGARWLRDNPWRALALAPAKVYETYRTDTSGLYEAVLQAPLSAPSRLASWLRAHQRLAESATYRYYALVLVLAAAAPFVVEQSRRVRLAPLIALPVLLGGFHVLFHGKDRFHLPVAPCLAVLAAVTVDGVLARAGSPRAASRGPGDLR